ncbi:MAG TPA: hypothetical protein VGE29_01645 [Prosthecobacter sp.]
MRMRLHSLLFLPLLAALPLTAQETKPPKPAIPTAAGSAAKAEAPAPNYTFYAEFVRVVDANTVAVNIDLGFGVWTHNQNLDLQGLPEPAPLATETAEQKASRLKMAARLRDLFANRSELILRTTKDKSTTPPRYLATFWADGENLNEALLKGE